MREWDFPSKQRGKESQFHSCGAQFKPGMHSLGHV